MASWGPTELYCLKCFHIKNTPDSRAEYARSSIQTTSYVPPEHYFNCSPIPLWPMTMSMHMNWEPKTKEGQQSRKAAVEARAKQNSTNMTNYRWEGEGSLCLVATWAERSCRVSWEGQKSADICSRRDPHLGSESTQIEKFATSGRFHLASPQLHSTSPQICARK